MSAPSSSFQGSYDVFLNFRGKDTRNGFTAYLYEALCSKGIKTFMDADNIAKGQEISPALLTAIEKSTFCIVVLSKNYASSPWCLEELVHILRCKNTMEKTVLPVFYDVDPSDVRERTGSFAKSFAKHEEKFKKKMERVQIWKEALTEVANLSGWDSRNRHEPTLIRQIIQQISDGLICRSSKDAKVIVGVDSHLSSSSNSENQKLKKRGISLLEEISMPKDLERKNWQDAKAMVLVDSHLSLSSNGKDQEHKKWEHRKKKGN